MILFFQALFKIFTNFKSKSEERRSLSLLKFLKINCKILSTQNQTRTQLLKVAPHIAYASHKIQRTLQSSPQQSMQANQNDFARISQLFLRQKHKLPQHMAWKLQYMLDLINDCAPPVASLNEDQVNEIKDLEDLTPMAVKVVFINIVTSILSPNMYCSFEKNCKIKVEGVMSRWVKVYASFSEVEIFFTNRKKKFKFTVESLECDYLSDLELELKYKGVRKSRLRFQHPNAAKNMLAKIRYLVEEYKIKLQSLNGEEEIINSRSFEQKIQKQYSILSRTGSNLFMVHKNQSKIHAEVFLRGHFWQIFKIAQFIGLQRFWNSKVRQQKITQIPNNIYIERRYKPSSFLSFERRTLTKLRLIKNQQNNYTYEQIHQVGTPTSKNIILSQIYIKVNLNLLSPKILKVHFDCTFNAKGYCTNSNSRSMLIDLFSDIMFIESKYNSLKESNKIQYRLMLEERVTNGPYTNLSALMKGMTTSENQTVGVEDDTLNEDEIYYSIADNDMNLDSLKECDVQNGEQYYDLDGDYFDTVTMADEQPHEKQTQPQMMKKKSSIEEIITSSNIDALRNTFNKLKPTKYDCIISVDYVKLIKQRIHQRIYLNKKFEQTCLKIYDWETPWYDPSQIIPAGKQYQVNARNQLIFINYDLIRGQKDSLIFVIKQVGANLITGKSVLNVSLPVDIFESRSLLQRSAASFGCAPKYLRPAATDTAMAQMKAVIGFVSSVSPLELIMLKPFNPILGQTFEAILGGIPIYYQQVSHHPPISAYYMTCEEFTLYGNLVAVANVSLNSGSGGNGGKMHIVFKNGRHFEVSFFPGEISGLIYGKRKYSVCAKAFVIERKQGLVAQISANKESKGLYQWKQLQVSPTLGDLIGGIFKVKPKFLQQNPPEKTLMYHPGLKKSDIINRTDLISGIWFSRIMINKQQINADKTAFPVQYCSNLLPSDSNFRMDILMHRLGDLARSQSQKEVLEDIQRRDRRLRQAANKKN